MPRTIPRTSAMSGTQSSLDSGAIENSAGYFLDRDFGRIEHGNAVPLEQRLRRSDFEGDLLRRRIAAVGPALVANLLQPIRLDRQTEQFPRIGFESLRHLARLQIVVGQRVIRREYAILH